jgi:hypothetical protein
MFVLTVKNNAGLETVRLILNIEALNNMRLSYDSLDKQKMMIYFPSETHDILRLKQWKMRTACLPRSGSYLILNHCI